MASLSKSRSSIMATKSPRYTIFRIFSPISMIIIDRGTGELRYPTSNREIFFSSRDHRFHFNLSTRKKNRATFSFNDSSSSFSFFFSSRETKSMFISKTFVKFDEKSYNPEGRENFSCIFVFVFFLYSFYILS